MTADADRLTRPSKPPDGRKRQKISKPSDAPVGNFSNYYAIRRDVKQQDDVSTDVRIGAIANWLASHRRIEGIGRREVQRVLDIGCNSGRLTLQLGAFI
jgi:hypothetical protein